MSDDIQIQRKLSQEEINRSIEYIFDHPEIIQAAFAKGIEDARRQYAAAGVPMVAMKNGRIYWFDPVTLEEVPRPENLPKSELPKNSIVD